MSRVFDPFQVHLDDPFSFWKEVRRDEPVFYAENLQAWCVTRYDDIMQVQQDPVTFSSRELLRRPVGLPAEADAIMGFWFDNPVALTLLDPPEHGPMRRYMNSRFTPAAIQRCEPRIRSLIDDLVGGLKHAEDGSIDLVADFTTRMPLLAIMAVLGMDLSLEPRYRAWVEELLLLLVAHQNLSDEVMVEYAGRQREYIDTVRALIADRRTNPRDDLITFLVEKAPNGQTLPDDNLAMQVMTLLSAGWETTAKSIPNILYELLRQPGLWQELAAGRLDVANVVEEGLRHTTSVIGLFRLATREVQLGGVTIPQGSFLMLNYASAGRDESKYDNPDVFDPRRVTSTTPLTFGHGVHYCLGAPLARLEIKLALESLANHFPTLTLQPGWTPRYRTNVQFRGLDSLVVRP